MGKVGWQGEMSMAYLFFPAQPRSLSCPRVLVSAQLVWAKPNMALPILCLP